MDLVQTYVDCFNDPRKRVTQILFAKGCALTAGLDGRDIASARKRAKGIYTKWVELECVNREI